MLKPSVTLKDLARQLRLSASTVSRALQNHPGIGLRTRERVQSLAQQLHYIPNLTALSLKKNRRFAIGVIVPELLNPFFSQTVSGIEATATQRGYLMTVCQSHEETDRERRAVTLLANNRVDGMLVVVAKTDTNYEHLSALQEQDLPLVLVDRAVGQMAASSVGCDVRAGAEEVTEFLIHRGVRHFGYLGGPDGLETSTERREGFLAALRRRSLPIRQNWLVATDLSTEAVEKATYAMLKNAPRPEAIVAFSDQVALDIHRVATALGLVPNRDLMLASFGNAPYQSYLHHPPLVSVDQQAYETGVQATNLLLRLIETPDALASAEHILLRPRLVVNE